MWHGGTSDDGWTRDVSTHEHPDERKAKHPQTLDNYEMVVQEWFGLPEGLALICAALISTYLFWYYGPVRVASFYMRQAIPEPRSAIGWAWLLVYGWVATSVFSVLILGLVFRVLLYGMDGEP